MPYIITTKHNDTVVYLYTKLNTDNGRVKREWTTKKANALLLFVNDAQLKLYIDKYFDDIEIETIFTRTAPRPRMSMRR